MERLYSKIVGMPVYVPENVRPVTQVQDVLVDPENGKVLALFVSGRGGKIITPRDIVAVKHGVFLRDADDILDIDEVLRVESVVSKFQPLGAMKVLTEGGKSLGKVCDFVIDDKAFVLKKIYSGKSVLGMVQYDSRIISYKDIVEIQADRVIVKDDLETVKARVAEEKKAGADVAMA